MAITIQASTQLLTDIKAQGHVLFVEEDYASDPVAVDVAKTYFPAFEAYAEDQKFKGAASSVLCIPIAHEQVSYFIVAGLGKRCKDTDKLCIEVLRRTLATVIRCAQSSRIASLAIQVPSAEAYGISAETLAEHISTTIVMTGYKFEKYITEKSRLIFNDIVVTLVSSDGLGTGVTHGTQIGEAVNNAREWVNMPPSSLTPADLADKALELSKEHGFSCEVFDHAQVESLGMGGLLGVSAGSVQECRLVIMEHKAKSASAPTIGLVGKGITFDSGGLSLKPPKHMETMKEDMSGAAAVIASMKAIAQINPDINIVAITPMAENLPSGHATKPGDILTFYNGKTAEVKNTDAEGRLILADALAYVTTNYKLDAVIDIATLTGACAHALGPFFTGLLTCDDKLAGLVDKAGDASGDYTWRLPLTGDYRKAVVGDIADLCNIGKANIMAGASTAAAFLEAFVENDTPWLHLDIAGTAYNVPGVSYYRPSEATGVGVRLFVELARHWNELA